MSCKTEIKKQKADQMIDLNIHLYHSFTYHQCSMLIFLFHSTNHFNSCLLVEGISEIEMQQLINKTSAVFLFVYFYFLQEYEQESS
jgi:hypothetical protein